MKALGDYIIFKVVKKEEKRTKSGIIVAQTGESLTTNSGDKVGTLTDFIVEDVGKDVAIDVKKGDRCIINLWQAQLFEEDEVEYAVVPEREIKAVL